jgi:Ca2+-binding EF-hand superfamily protein
MSATETKLSQALLKKRAENNSLEKPLTLEKILLKFDKLRGVVGHVKTIFEQVSVNGKLNNAGLEAVMKRLNVKMSMEDILDLFDFVNIQEHDDITMKEFLVALTIGMVLEVIPAFSDIHNTPVQQTKQAGQPPAPVKRSFSVLLGHNHEIKEMLNLIVSAYLIFDVEARGYISRDVIENMMEEVVIYAIMIDAMIYVIMIYAMIYAIMMDAMIYAIIIDAMI